MNSMIDFIHNLKKRLNVDVMSCIFTKTVQNLIVWLYLIPFSPFFIDNNSDESSDQAIVYHDQDDDRFHNLKD